MPLTVISAFSASVRGIFFTSSSESSPELTLATQRRQIIGSNAPHLRKLRKSAVHIAQPADYPLYSWDIVVLGENERYKALLCILPEKPYALGICARLCKGFVLGKAAFQLAVISVKVKVIQPDVSEILLGNAVENEYPLVIFL